MSNSVKRRVDRLSARSDEWGDVLTLIRAKKCYSELTDDQKKRYCRYYYGTECAVVEKVEQMVTGEPLDFVLKKRSPKLSPEEEEKCLKESIAEVERIINEDENNERENK